VALPAHVHEWLPAWLKVATAVGLLAVLAVALLWRPKQGAEDEPLYGEEAEAVDLEVTGMTCSHCAASVARALRECEGVASAEVDLERGAALVRGVGLDPARLCAAVRALGYGASPFSP
jgi:copper chaperone CopZ